MWVGLTGKHQHVILDDAKGGSLVSKFSCAYLADTGEQFIGISFGSELAPNFSNSAELLCTPTLLCEEPLNLFIQL